MRLLKEEAIGRKGNDEMGIPKTKAEDVEAAAEWLEIKLKPGNSEKEIAGGKYRGPLHGIPIAIKESRLFRLRSKLIEQEVESNEDEDASSVLRREIERYEDHVGIRRIRYFGRPFWHGQTPR